MFILELSDTRLCQQYKTKVIMFRNICYIRSQKNFKYQKLKIVLPKQQNTDVINIISGHYPDIWNYQILNISYTRSQNNFT